MEEEDLLVSKIDFEEMTSSHDYEKEKIKQRNNYYQALIANNNPPVALNALCLRKINSKEVFEKQILNRGTHLSTLIPEYKITRDFIFSLLKNYQLFDLTEDESRFLLHKYFTDSLEVPSEQTDEAIDFNNDNVEIIEPEDDSEDEIEEESEESEEEIENENLEPFENIEEIDTYPKSEIYPNLAELEKEEKIEEKKEIINDKTKKKKESLIQKQTIREDEESKYQQSTLNFSSIASMPTENFSIRKNMILKKNNMSLEKIEETKEIKKNISLFLKNALEKRSGIDKRTTIIQFLYKNNFKGNFNASFFDIKDENGDLIFGQDIIDEWYNAIQQIEEKQKAAFECSQLIITACLYGVEWGAKKMGITELSTICSEVKDPSNLPRHLESTKQSLSNIIDNNIPNNFIMDLIFFIGNVYIKNKAGISPL